MVGNMSTFFTDSLLPLKNTIHNNDIKMALKMLKK